MIKYFLIFLVFFVICFVFLLSYEAGLSDAYAIQSVCSQKVAPEEFNCYIYIESKSGSYNAQKKCYQYPWLGGKNE